MKILKMLFTEVGVLLVLKVEELVDNLEVKCWMRRREIERLRWLPLTTVS